MGLSLLGVAWGVLRWAEVVAAAAEVPRIGPQRENSAVPLGGGGGGGGCAASLAAALDPGDGWCRSGKLLKKRVFGARGGGAVLTFGPLP